MKSNPLQLFLIVFLYTLICSLMVCVRVLYVVDLLRINHDFDNNETMKLKAIIEREGLEKELLDIRSITRYEKSKMDDYINRRFPRKSVLESDTYSDKMKLMIMDITEVSLKFQQDLNIQIRNILKTRSGLQLMEELKTLKNAVAMLARLFHILELDEEINRLEAVSQHENGPVENEIKKTLGEIREKEIKLREIVETNSMLDFCTTNSTSNCKASSELHGTFETLVNYLKQANEGFQVLQQSDLHFEKQPYLVKFLKHLQNININTARYLELVGKNGLSGN